MYRPVVERGWMTPSPLARRKDPLHVSKLLESLKAWRQSMTDAWASDVAADETPGAPAPVEAGARLQSGAIVGIFVLLVFYFLYFASPILIPIIMALLLSTLLAPFVRLLEWIRVPRTLGSLIAVAAAVGALFGIAASLSGPAQRWLTEPQRFSRLEEKLRPLTAPFEKLQYATEQVEKATAPRDVPPIQKVEVTQPGLSGLIANGSGHVVSTIAGRRRHNETDRYVDRCNQHKIERDIGLYISDDFHGAFLILEGRSDQDQFPQESVAR